MLAWLLCQAIELTHGVHTQAEACLAPGGEHTKVCAVAGTLKW